MTERSINQTRSIDRAISPQVSRIRRIFPRKLFESISSRGQMAGFCMDYDRVSRGFHLKAITQLQARFIYRSTISVSFKKTRFQCFFAYLDSGWLISRPTVRSGLRLQITFERRRSRKSWVWRNLLPIIHSGWKRSLHGNVIPVSIFLRS